MAKEGFKNRKETIKRDKEGKFLEGTEPGPGRPEGSFSFTTLVKKRLEKYPEEAKDIVGFYLKDKKMRALLWKMIDGLPTQKIATEEPLSIKIIKDEDLDKRINEIEERIINIERGKIKKKGEEKS